LLLARDVVEGLLAPLLDLVLLRDRSEGLHPLAVLRGALPILLALALELALPLAEGRLLLPGATLLLGEFPRRPRLGLRATPGPLPLRPRGPPFRGGFRLRPLRLLLVHQPRLQELVSKTLETHLGTRLEPRSSLGAGGAEGAQDCPGFLQMQGPVGTGRPPSLPRPDRSRVARVIDSFTSRGDVS